MFVDKKLNWVTLVQNLCLHVARHSVFLYKICFNVPKKLCMLYHSLIYSKMRYSITMWETASKTMLDLIRVMQNRILRTMLFCNLRIRLSFIYKRLNILKLDDMYELEMAKFMYKLHYNKLSKNLYNFFQKLTFVQEYETRLVNSAVFYLPRVNKIFGQNQFCYKSSTLRY